MLKKKTAEDFRWYRYYPADNLANTSQLSHVELGVYRRMMDHYWSNGNALPDDVYQIVDKIGDKIFQRHKYDLPIPDGFNSEEVTATIVKHLLEGFFERDGDGQWCHLWLDEYRADNEESFKKRQAGGLARQAQAGRDGKGKFTSTAGPVAGHEVQQPPRYIEKSREDKSREDKSREDEIRGEDPAPKIFVQPDSSSGRTINGTIVPPSGAVPPKSSTAGPVAGDSEITSTAGKSLFQRDWSHTPNGAATPSSAHSENDAATALPKIKVAPDRLIPIDPESLRKWKNEYPKANLEGIIKTAASISQYNPFPDAEAVRAHIVLHAERGNRRAA